LAGISVERQKFWIYTLCGLLAGIASVILSSRVTSGQPTLGAGFELQSVAAVVLGGVSLFGGRGSLGGVLLGVVLIGFLGNGLNLLGVSSFIQEIVVGAVLIGAVILDVVVVR